MPSNSIVHVDADSFFASVERAHNPLLHDKPVCVITGERGCVLAATYDAKKLGISTAMPIWEAKKILPPKKAYYIRSNFSLYARYSARMFEIFRNISPQVEKYSIDEGFIDLTGLRRLYRTSYQGIAALLQERVMSELGLPVSIGLASTKTLAKIASKKAKPFGIYEVDKNNIKGFLKKVTFDQVPGIGRNSAALLEKFSIMTPLGFIETTQERVRSLMHKPGVALWKELQGQAQTKVETQVRPPKSISRIRSFSPTQDYRFLEAQLVHHIFLCTYKMRTHKLASDQFSMYIRTKHFQYIHKDYREPYPHANALSFIARATKDFHSLVHTHEVRSVGIVFYRLQQAQWKQVSLFEEDNYVRRQEQLLCIVDEINDKMGKYVVRPARLQGKEYSEWVYGLDTLDIPYLGEFS